MTYPEHIQWIIDNLSEDLNKALSKDNSYKTIDNPLDIFLLADPTNKKKLTQWLVDTYIKGGFRWEDIQSGSNSKVFNTLSLYIKHKSKLDSDNHIGQYNSLGSVYKDIAPFIKSDKSSRSVKRDEQAQAYEESDILIKSDSLTVVIPKTEYASKWWGKGTQWCTAGDKNNVFEGYYKDGPLIIIIVNGVKTQLHVDLVDKDRSVQFMDEHDARIDIKFVENNWKLLKNVMEWAIKYNGSILKYIPEILKTEEICLEAVRLCGSVLEYVPKKLVTAELCLKAVKQNGRALYYTPKNLVTEELCLEAVRQNGNALAHVPEPLKTVELCLEAVKQNGMALYYVPKALITSELCLEAVRKDGEALRYVPGDLKTSELCLEVVKQNGLSLRNIPEHLKIAELCLEAVRQNGRALRDVPVDLRTPELCLEAVKQNGMALYNAHEALITSELCLEEVRKDGEALRYVPGDLKTAELCLEAVKQAGRALSYIPEHLRTPELYLEAVRQNGEALRCVPESLRTAELCLEAVRQDSMAFSYIPRHLRTAEIFLCYNLDGVKKWDYSVLEELKLQLNISNTLDKSTNLY